VERRENGREFLIFLGLCWILWLHGN
jgi:hypothetical protein